MDYSCFFFVFYVSFGFGEEGEKIAVCYSLLQPSYHNKHLMTGPKGNSEFFFPETLNVPRGEAEVNIEVEGKQNSLFPEGPVIKCFVIPPNSKYNNTQIKLFA